MTISMRCLDWTFRRSPLQREKMRPEDHKDSQRSNSQGRGQIILDACDLMFNLRGIGWSYSKGLQISKETRPTTSRWAFVAATLISAIKNIIFLDAMHYTVQCFSPDTFESPQGGSIFDPSLPPILDLARATAITWISGLGVCTIIDTFYDVFTLIGVALLQQHPTQWPPISDAPWRAESLSEMWSKRWHQVFRVCFLSLSSFFF